MDQKAIAAKGFEDGVQAGIEQGIKQGIEQGIEQIIYNMLKQNVPLEDIAKFTNLDIEKIKSIKLTNFFIRETHFLEISRYKIYEKTWHSIFCIPYHVIILCLQFEADPFGTKLFISGV